MSNLLDLFCDNSVCNRPLYPGVFFEVDAYANYSVIDTDNGFRLADVEVSHFQDRGWVCPHCGERQSRAMEDQIEAVVNMEALQG